MKDALGERMKNLYENRTRTYLPRRTYTLLRIDGKAFHTFTKKFAKPFDYGFVNDMNQTAIYLCKNIQGAKFAFVQSDEISILVTDFETPTTDMWFDGNIQKIASVSASFATTAFNKARLIREAKKQKVLDEESLEDFKFAEFDSRTWTIPSRNEVVNYFIWRQQDTVRNSISSCAQALWSHKELEGKNQDDMQEMCFQKGFNWNELDPKLKRGRFIMKKEFELEAPTINGKIGTYKRNLWVVEECPVFTQNKDFLLNLIPILE